MGSSQTLQHRFKRLGLGLLRPSEGLLALQKSMNGLGNNHTEIQRDLDFFDFGYYGVITPATDRPLGKFHPIYSEVTISKGAASNQSVIQEVDSTKTQERVLSQIKSTFEAIIGIETDINSPLIESGLDSLGAVEFRSSLSQMFGIELSPTLVFD